MTAPGPRFNPMVRRDLLRGLILWTPLFVIFTALAALNLVLALDGNGGSWVVLAITGLIALLVGYSSLQSLRDMFSAPTESRGVIVRKWDRREGLFFRGRYLRMNRRVFRVHRPLYDGCPDTGGGLRIIHYPHTNAVVAWETIDLQDRPEAAEPAPPPGTPLPPPPALRPTEPVAPPRFDRPAERPPDDSATPR